MMKFEETREGIDKTMRPLNYFLQKLKENISKQGLELIIEELKTEIQKLNDKDQLVDVKNLQAEKGYWEDTLKKFEDKLKNSQF